MSAVNNEPEILKRGRGRPPIKNVRTRQVNFRLTEDEAELVKRAAAATGLTVSTFMRGTAVSAAIDALREKP